MSFEKNLRSIVSEFQRLEKAVRKERSDLSLSIIRKIYKISPIARGLPISVCVCYLLAHMSHHSENKKKCKQ